MESNYKVDGDDLEELKKMPACAEKTLITLMSDFSRRDRLESLPNEALKLKEQIDLEGLNSFEVDQIFKDIRTAFRNGQYQKAFDGLKQTHAEMRSLNIVKLLRLTRENNDALDVVKNKDIFLFIGMTGSGKSTTLHFLGGSEMIRENDRIVPKEPITNPGLQRIKVGSSHIESETQNVIPIVVPVDGTDTIIFCDTPGFEDTRGSEIDISNGIAIRKCVELCKGIKPVIIVSNQLGDKLQFLVELAEVLNSMFINFESDVRDFMFLYTKFEGPEKIKNILEETQKDLNERESKKEKISKSFKIIIDRMLNSIKRSKPILIDPINGERTNFLERILLDDRFIEKPDEKVSDSLSVKSQQVLETQIEKLFTAIDTGMRLLNYSDYTIYRFKQLKELKSILKRQEVNKKFDSIVIKLKENFDKQFNDKLDELKNRIQQNVRLDDQFIVDMLNFSRNLKNSESLFEEIDAENASESPKDRFAEIINGMCEIFENVLTTLIDGGVYEQATNIAIALDNLKNLIVKNEELQIGTDTSKLKQIYEKFKTTILDQVQKVTDKIGELIKKINDPKKKAEPREGAIDELNNSFLQINYSYFETLSKQLSMIRSLSEPFKNHIDEKMLKYDDCHAALVRAFVQKSTAFDKVITEENKDSLVDLIDQQKLDMDEINETWSFFKLALACYPLHDHYKYNSIEANQTSFLNRIGLCVEWLTQKADEQIIQLEDHRMIHADSMEQIEFVEGIQKNEKEKVGNHSHVDYSLLEKLFSALQSLQFIALDRNNNSPPNANANNKNFFSQIDRLVNCMGKIKTKILQNLSNYESLNGVGAMIRVLENLKWINKFKRNYFTFIIQDFIELIDYQEYLLNCYSSGLDLNDLITETSADKIKEIEKLNNLISNSTLLTPIAEKIDDIYSNLMKESGASAYIKPDRKTNHSEKLRLKVAQLVNRFNQELEEKSKDLTDSEIDIALLNKIHFFLKKFPLTKLEIQSEATISNLHKYLNTRVNLTKIEEDFNIILMTNFQTKDENIKKAKRLNNLFLELRLMSKEFGHLLVYLPSTLNDSVKCSRKLVEYQERVHAKMESNIKETFLQESGASKMKATDLEANIRVFKEFKHFLNDDELFAKHSNCSDTLNNLNFKIFNDARKLIINDRLESGEIKRNFKRLDRQNSVEKAQHEKLNHTLNDQIKRICKVITSDLDALILDNDQTKIRKIYETVEGIQEAKTELVDYIEESSKMMIEKIENMVKETFTTIVKDELKRINDLFNKCDANGETRLQTYSDNRLQLQLRRLGVDQSLLDQIKNFDKSKSIEAVIDDYVKNLTFENIRINSPKSFNEKLSKFTFEGIENCKLKFAEELKAKIVKELNSNYSKIQDIELAYLPDDVKNYLQQKISATNKSTKLAELEKNLENLRFEANFSQQENMIPQNDVFINIQNIYKQYKNDHDSTQLIDDFVLRSVDTFVYNFNQAIRDGKLDIQLNNAQLLCIVCAELISIIDNQIVRNSLDKKFKYCTNIINYQFVRNRDTLKSLLDTIEQRANVSKISMTNELNEVKTNFERLLFFVNFEESLSIKNISIYRDPSDSSLTATEKVFASHYNTLLNKFRTFLNNCRESFNQEMSKDLFDVTKTLSVYDSMGFLSSFNSIFKDGQKIDHNQDFKSIIIAKMNKVEAELTSLLNDLSTVAGNRRFQSYFDDLFENISTKFNFVHEMERNLQKLPNEINIKQIKDKLTNLLVENIQVLFVVLEQNITLMLDSLGENLQNKENVEEYSNQFYNAYFSIAGFKTKMKPMFEKHFPDNQNIDKIPMGKIYEKLNFLKDSIETQTKACKELIKKSNQTRKVVDNGDDTMRKLEDQIKKAERQNDELEKKLVAQTQTRDKLAEKKRELENDKNKAKDENDEQKFQELEKNQNETEKNLTEAYNSIDKLKKESADNKKDLTELREQKAKHEQDNLTKINEKEQIETSIKAVLESVSKSFKSIKHISNLFLMYKKEIDSELNKLLDAFINEAGGFEIIGKLAMQLKSGDDSVGNLIVSEHKQFESYQRSVFNRKTLSNDINYVLKDLQGKNVDKKQLENHFKMFDSIYKRLINEYLSPDIKYPQFISNLRLLTSSLRSSDINKINWNNKVEEKIPELVANIFALWTLLSSGKYFNITEKQYLFLPHPAQVISIFRMLGLGYTTGFQLFIYEKAKSMMGYNSETSLRNNLVQIGTGEGKSVTLAVTAVLLALLGFDVFCVCYSQYLSDRDYSAFKTLFEILNLTENIFYGTFNKICEDTINANGDVRSIVNSLITKDAYSVNHQINKKSNNPRILLIDEVDVFFTEDFYGSSYNPMMTLKDTTIRNLIQDIWNQKDNKLTLSQVKSFPSYSQCVNRFREWQQLLDEAVKEMLLVLESFKTHKYFIKENKIGYKYQDEINFNINYGYNTIFAYLKENKAGNITSAALQNNLGILVRIGAFSYAEIPLQNFNSIIGVTGTLNSLNDRQKQIIENNYQIKNFTFTPSVYGRNNLLFDETRDVLLEKEENHYKIICQEIENKITGSKPVAVFVVFETIKDLYKFYNSNEFVPLKSRARCLTEEANSVERKSLINGSTVVGRITLFTRSFGRGTDFIVFDENISRNGGVHVIQTFLSEEYSEEVQIKGRTARQGEPGTYQLILSIKSLEKFQIWPGDIQNISRSGYYNFIDQKRRQFFEIKYDESIKFVDSIKDKHVMTSQFLNYLFDANRYWNQIKDFLIRENKSVGGKSTFKTLILLDATGSMFHLLDKTKKTIEQMFQRITRVLNENKINDKSFQIKIAVFRNYNSSEDKIYEESSWETKPQNLVNFLSLVESEGGWDHEAIEIGFYNANQLNGLSQVILIGDAPPNTINEINEKRNHPFYQHIWQSSVRYNPPTNYQTELKKLTDKGIKVHAFYVDDRAKSKFKEIAQQTGGNSKSLNINSHKGSEDLLNLVNIEILQNIGGENLVESYNRIYHVK